MLSWQELTMLLSLYDDDDPFIKEYLKVQLPQLEICNCALLERQTVGTKPLIVAQELLWL